MLDGFGGHILVVNSDTYRMLGWCLGCGLMLWSGPAWGQLPIETTFDPLCATDSAKESVSDELAVRLEGAAADALEAWSLSWVMKDGQCQMVLDDGQMVMALPVDPDADEEVLRDAAIRLAWVITTEPISPDEPADPVATTEPVVTPGGGSDAAVKADDPGWGGWVLERTYLGAEVLTMGAERVPLGGVGAKLGFKVSPSFRLAFVAGLGGNLGVNPNVQTQDQNGNERGREEAEVGFQYARLEADWLVWSPGAVNLFVSGSLGTAGADFVSATQDPRGDEERLVRPHDYVFADLGARVGWPVAKGTALEGFVGYRFGELIEPRQGELQFEGLLVGVGVRFSPGEVFGD